MTKRKHKQKTERVLCEVSVDPPLHTGLPIAVDNPWKSLGEFSDPHCHQWQRGHHIDTLAKD
jgi:hypothetical protein